MLRDVQSLEQYFMQYGPLLGRKACGVLNPVYSPLRDKSLDLSFISQGDHKVVPYPCQATVINALALAFRKQMAMILCGEMGTGKTLLGATAIHAHMTQLRGRTGYRVLIMCPNHLIGKWEEEILEAVPESRVYRFSRSDENAADDSYRQVAAYIRMCEGGAKVKATHPVERIVECEVSTGVGPHSVDGVLIDQPYQVETVQSVVKGRATKRGRSRWSRPAWPEWVIVGRNQAKADPGWQGFGEGGGTASVMKTVSLGQVEVKDLNGQAVMDDDGTPLMEHRRGRVPYCPKCGQPTLYGFETMWEKQVCCTRRMLVEVAAEERTESGLDVICPLPVEFIKTKTGKMVKHNHRRYAVKECGAPLWQWVGRPRKWAPAKLFHKQGRKLFDFFMLDEMQEERGDGTVAQANAAGKLMKTGRRVLGLTGTLIGGYAHHMFPTLMRMSPGSLIADGYEWGDGKKSFSEDYGRIDTIRTTKIGCVTKTRSSPGGGKAKGSTSMRKVYDGDTTETTQVKPGVMPSFFGKHLIEKSVFISLDEMTKDLPELIDDDRSLIGVAMDPDLDAEYGRVAEELVSTNTELLMKGNSKLLGAMLHTLLEYPDKPYGWTGPFPGRDAVGYWGESKSEAGWNDVVQPADLPEGVVYAKEQALYDLCVREAHEGRQVWVYCTQTGKRDVQERLKGILERGGLKVKVMRSNQVDSLVRRDWMFEHGPHHNVIISHPELVSTGLDFFDKRNWSFNFATIAFYEGDYRVDLVRQASRRHWRIGQKTECRTFYFYYESTMQERQILHVGEKYAAAKSLEGKFSAEGLAAMSGGGLAMTEMAKALSTKIEDPRAAWAKLRDDAKVRLVKLANSGGIDALADAVAADARLSLVADFIIHPGDWIDPDSLTLSADDLDLLATFNPDDMLAKFAAMGVKLA